MKGDKRVERIFEHKLKNGTAAVEKKPVVSREALIEKVLRLTDEQAEYVYRRMLECLLAEKN